MVITTALVPGKKAPTLITQAMVERMRPGSVIVDMAAGQGGNCEMTRPGSQVKHKGVTILGETNIVSLVSGNASSLYARNVTSLIEYINRDGSLFLETDDAILSESLIVRKGKVIHKRVIELLEKESGRRGNG